MTTYVALLRSVNVGGRKVPMAELRRLLEGLGFDDVQTYIQSGNVVLTSEASAAALSATLKDGLRRRFGFDIGTIVRTRRELEKVLQANPLLGGGRDPAKLHVTFLAARPATKAIEGEFGSDEWVVVGREVYLHCPDGYGRTKLDNAFLERRLGVAATTRNWRTVTTLAEMAG